MLYVRQGLHKIIESTLVGYELSQTYFYILKGILINLFYYAWGVWQPHDCVWPKESTYPYKLQ